jgi:hypothetical protein
MSHFKSHLQVSWCKTNEFSKKVEILYRCALRVPKWRAFFPQSEFQLTPATISAKTPAKTLATCLACFALPILPCWPVGCLLHRFNQGWLEKQQKSHSPGGGGLNLDVSLDITHAR